MPEIMIFKSGSYPQGAFSKERVRRMVDAYDPDGGIEAPVVIGHRWEADSDEAQYAHGWVRSLRMDGAGKVWADIPEFSAETRRAMAENKLRYVSAEIFEFDKLDERQPPYLKAVALLGRDTPGVATTRLPTLFERNPQGILTTIDSESGVVAFTRRVDAADRAALATEEPVGEAGNAENQEGEMEQVEELRAQLERTQAEMQTFRQENETLRAAARRAEASGFYATFRDGGMVPPAVFEDVVALDAALSDDARERLRSFVSNLQPQVALGDTHVAARAPASSQGAGLNARIKSFQAERGFATFADAATALYAEAPQVFEEEIA